MAGLSLARNMYVSVTPQVTEARLNVLKASAVIALFLSMWLVPWCLWSELKGGPANDDPFYAKPIAWWCESGTLQVARQYGLLTASSLAHIAVGAMTCIGQDFSYRNLYLACMVQQAIGVAGLYVCARRLRVEPFSAFIFALTLAAFPLYFGHGFTFMTDGPATAWSAVALACFVIGFVYQRLHWLALGSLAIGVGYWVRQTNGILLLIPLASVVLAGSSTESAKLGKLIARDQAKWLVASLSIAAVSILVLESGWLVPTSLVRTEDVAPQWNGEYWKRSIIAAYGWSLLIGWYALPLTAGWLVSARAEHSKLSTMERRVCASAALAACVIMLVPFATTQGRACLTNATGAFIQNAHFGPIFLSDMDEPGRWGDLGGVEWPLLVWQVLSLFAIASSSVLAWWAAWTVLAWFRTSLLNRDGGNATDDRSARVHLALASAMLGTTVVASAILVLFIEPHMDRYWLFLLPVLCMWWIHLTALGCWRPGAWCRAWAVVALMAAFSMSVIFSHDMLAWNTVRWQYVNNFLSSGNSAEQLDGGRDVNAWLRMDEDPNTSARSDDTSRWWSGRATWALSVGDRPGWTRVEKLTWHSWATGRVHSLLVLKKSGDAGTSSTNVGDLDVPLHARAQTCDRSLEVPVSLTNCFSFDNEPSLESL